MHHYLNVKGRSLIDKVSYKYLTSLFSLLVEETRVFGHPSKVTDKATPN